MNTVTRLRIAAMLLTVAAVAAVLAVYSSAVRAPNESSSKRLTNMQHSEFNSCYAAEVKKLNKDASDGDVMLISSHCGTVAGFKRY